MLANQTTVKLKIETIIARGSSFHVSFALLYVYRFCSLSNIECLTMKTSHFLEQYSSWRREDSLAFFFQFPWYYFYVPCPSSLRARSFYVIKKSAETVPHRFLSVLWSAVRNCFQTISFNHRLTIYTIVVVQSRQYRIDSQSSNYLSVLKKYRYQSVFRSSKNHAKSTKFSCYSCSKTSIQAKKHKSSCSPVLFLWFICDQFNPFSRCMPCCIIICCL